jgi:chorismate mutase/prephenate dehydratase
MSCELYELDKLWENIEDRPDNSTRFLIIGREAVGPSGDDKTSMVVSVHNKPGALHNLLESFRKHDLDMTRLESRPSRSSKWSYVFFIDFAGHMDDPVATKVLEEMATDVLDLKVLGSYPRGVL